MKKRSKHNNFRCKKGHYKLCCEKDVSSSSTPPTSPNDNSSKSSNSSSRDFPRTRITNCYDDWICKIEKYCDKFNIKYDDVEKIIIVTKNGSRYHIPLKLRNNFERDNKKQSFVSVEAYSYNSQTKNSNNKVVVKALANDGKVSISTNIIRKSDKFAVGNMEFTPQTVGQMRKNKKQMFKKDDKSNNKLKNES